MFVQNTVTCIIFHREKNYNQVSGNEKAHYNMMENYSRKYKTNCESNRKTFLNLCFNHIILGEERGLIHF